MDNNEIKITHFVNPHYFFFRWVRDEGFDEELNIMERKIENIAIDLRENINSDINSKVPIESKYNLNDVVGAFVVDWHKWIRVAIKKKENDGRFCVWAQDYGFPMVINEKNIIKLPRAFWGMHLKNKRVLTGGIENCYPACIRYDITIASTFKEKLLNWSSEAIEMTQELLNKAVKLNFENVHEYRPLNRPHFYGRLMMQCQDAALVNVLKCLIETNRAALTEHDFADELKTLETLKQPYWTTFEGNSYDTKLSVSPLIIVKEKTGYTDNEYFQDVDDVEDARTMIDLDVSPSLEDNEFFDDSVSVFQSKKLNQQIDSDGQYKMTQPNNEPTTNNNDNPEKTPTNSQASCSKLASSPIGNSQQNNTQSTNTNRNQKNRSINNGNQARNNQFRNRQGTTQHQNNFQLNRFNPRNRRQMQNLEGVDQNQQSEFGSVEFNKNFGKRSFENIPENPQNIPMNNQNAMHRQNQMPSFEGEVKMPSFPFNSMAMRQNQMYFNVHRNAYRQRNRQNFSGAGNNRNSMLTKLNENDEKSSNMVDIEKKVEELQLGNPPVARTRDRRRQWKPNRNNHKPNENVAKNTDAKEKEPNE